ncbi:MAG: hypothetical protein SGI97_06575 [candidate division Zixibacteria bacterium]|nr:hypothetical protein [candidate division Zixibacteria bacterium]
MLHFVFSFFFPFLAMGKSSSESADWKKKQAVTYASFSYVNHVASSLTHIFYATTNGILRFNKQTNEWEPPLTGTNGTNSLNGEEVKRIWAGTFGDKLYAETELGLYEYDLLFESWFPITELPKLEKNYEHIAPSQTLIPPVGSNYFGDGNFVDLHGRRYSIRDAIDDNSGTLWIGTWGYGPAKASASSWVMELLPFGLIQNRTDAIYVEDTLIWFAGSTLGQPRTGITAMTRDASQFFHIESGVSSDLPPVDVNCLAGDAKSLYVGTSTGLTILERQFWRQIRSVDRRHGLGDDNVLSLKKIGDSLFVGTAGGLTLIHHNLDSIRQVYPNQFSNRAVYDLERIGDFLWLATDAGAFRLSLISGELHEFIDTTQLIFSRVFDIEQSGENIWLAATNGLVKVNARTGVVTSFQDLSTRTSVRALAVNDKIAAVASDRGLTVFVLEGKNPRTWEFTTDDGLASNYVFDLYIDGDYIWVATDQGVTRFHWNDPKYISNR